MWPLYIGSNGQIRKSIPFSVKVAWYTWSSRRPTKFKACPAASCLMQPAASNKQANKTKTKNNPRAEVEPRWRAHPGQRWSQGGGGAKVDHAKVDHRIKVDHLRAEVEARNG